MGCGVCGPGTGIVGLVVRWWDRVCPHPQRGMGGVEGCAGVWLGCVSAGTCWHVCGGYVCLNWGDAGNVGMGVEASHGHIVHVGAARGVSPGH